MPERKNIEPLILMKSSRFEVGYFQNSSQPSVLIAVIVTASKVPASALDSFDDLSKVIVSKAMGRTSQSLPYGNPQGHPVLSRVLGLTLNILASMQMPIMSGARVNKLLSRDQNYNFLIALPAISERIPAPQNVFKLVSEIMNVLVRNQPVDRDAVLRAIQKLILKFKRVAPAGANTLRFLEAAHEMSIPWRHVAMNVYQFGWGSKSCWLDSTFTEKTSAISANLAKDKSTQKHLGCPKRESRTPFLEKNESER